ncbi:hypothetical protein ACFSLT_00605 [Novosphingobium resinovorum]
MRSQTLATLMAGAMLAAATPAFAADATASPPRLPPSPTAIPARLATIRCRSRW